MYPVRSVNSSVLGIGVVVLCIGQSQSPEQKDKYTTIYPWYILHTIAVLCGMYHMYVYDTYLGLPCSCTSRRLLLCVL